MERFPQRTIENVRRSTIKIIREATVAEEGLLVFTEILII
jgi:hypothetical protein